MSIRTSLIDVSVDIVVYKSAQKRKTLPVGDMMVSGMIIPPK